MDRKLTFIEELNSQLKEYQLEKIILAQQRTQRNNPRIAEFEAKQSLIELGNANESSNLQDSVVQISRWNSKKGQAQTERGNSHSKLTKRNNLFLERPHSYENPMMPSKSFSSRQIPHLKLLLQKLQTPTNNKKKKTEERMVLTSARKKKSSTIEKDQVFFLQKYNHQNTEELSHTRKLIAEKTNISKRRPKTIQHNNSENKNPILYPILDGKKQRSRTKQYQKINRKNNNAFNLINSMNSGKNPNVDQIVHQKELLQNLIKNTINHQGQTAFGNTQNIHNLNLLGQYGNLNYFSNSFKNQSKKRGTLTNLLM